MPTKKQKTKNGFSGDGGADIAEVKLPSKKVITDTSLKKGNGHQFSEQNNSSFLEDQELLSVLTEVKNGNFTVRMPINQLGLSGKVCDTLNDFISLY